MGKPEITIKVYLEQVDEAIEKTTQLVELLKEAEKGLERFSLSLTSKPVEINFSGTLEKLGELLSSQGDPEATDDKS